MNEAVWDNALGIGPDFRPDWRRVAGVDGGQDNHPFVLKALRPAAAVPPAPREIDEPPIVRPLVQTLLDRSDRTRTS